MRAAFYARVSTHDQQTIGLQTESMSAYIRDRGWKVVSQVKDVGSGAKERPGREGLLNILAGNDHKVSQWQVNRNVLVEDALGIVRKYLT